MSPQIGFTCHLNFIFIKQDCQKMKCFTLPGKSEVSLLVTVTTVRLSVIGSCRQESGEYKVIIATMQRPAVIYRKSLQSLEQVI